MLDHLIGLFKGAKPQDYMHPLFGPLSYSKEKFNGMQFWCGESIFDGHPITLKIYTEGARPSSDQEEFLRTKMDNLQLLVDRSADLVKSHFEIWCEKDYAEHFLKEFMCIELHVPQWTISNFWQITFAMRENTDFVFTISFDGDKAICTDLDG